MDILSLKRGLWPLLGFRNEDGDGGAGGSMSGSTQSSGLGGSATNNTYGGGNRNWSGSRTERDARDAGNMQAGTYGNEVASDPTPMRTQASLAVSNGLSNVQGLNPNNPTQSAAEISASANVDRWIGAAVPSFVSMVNPFAGMALAAARGDLTVADTLARFAGMVNPALGMAARGINAFSQDKFGEFAGSTMGRFAGEEIGEAVAGPLGRMVGASVGSRAGSSLGATIGGDGTGSSETTGVSSGSFSSMLNSIGSELSSRGYSDSSNMSPSQLGTLMGYSSGNSSSGLIDSRTGYASPLSGGYQRNA